MAKHKTSVSRDALHIGLSEELHSFMKVHFETIRPNFPTAVKSDNFFISYHASPLSASDLAHILTCELMGVGYEHRASCTKFSKMTTTLVSKY